MGVQPSRITKLTIDEDDNRSNTKPSIVKDSNGRLTLFYSKKWYTGRTSPVTLTQTGSFQITVGAGTGNLNSTAVSWSETPVTVAPNTYTLIYADLSGNILLDVTASKTILSESIPLAYVNVGNSAITNMELVESSGTYIFVQRQVNVAGEWVWEDREERLNSGEAPTAYVESGSDKINLYYVRDKNYYLRIFDPVDSETFEYIHHVTESAGVLYPDNDLRSFSTNSIGAGNSLVSGTNQVLYDIGSIGVSIKEESGSLVPQITSPYLTGSYLSYILGTPYVDFFTYDGNSYTLERSIVPELSQPDWPAFIPWTDTPGVKYVGVRVSHTLYNDPWVTDPADYVTINIPSEQDLTVLEGSQYNSFIYEFIPRMGVGSAGSNLEKTVEQDQFYKFIDSDTGSNMSVGGSKSALELTLEQDQLYTFVDIGDSAKLNPQKNSVGASKSNLILESQT